jgi:hypothetical protein
MFWLAVVTASILYGQFWVMRLDTRPWIQVKASDQIPMPQVGTPMSAPMSFVNVGKTPAKRFLAYMFVEVVDIDKSPHLPNPEGADKGTYTFVTSGVVFPNVTVDGAANLVKATSETTSEVRPLTDPEYQRLMHGEAYLAIYAVAFYRDAYNTRHWTTFCGWHSFTTGRVSANACIAYNNVDDNILW